MKILSTLYNFTIWNWKQQIKSFGQNRKHFKLSKFSVFWNYVFNKSFTLFQTLTGDLGGRSKCSEFTAEICKRVRDIE